jgi:two-component system OmpR family response regulator
MLHKIFIVDDDKLFGQMLSDYLSGNKMYEVVLITSGKECIERLHEQPDVIILDYHLDAANKKSDNGMAILEKIKKTNNKIHVIMLSGQMHYGVAATTIAKGAEQYVIKDEEAFKNVDLILKDMTKVV